MQEFVSVYQSWAKTDVGKVVRDFMWSVLSAAVMAGLVELAVALEAGVANFFAFWQVFLTGALVGAGKAISLYVGKYR